MKCCRRTLPGHTADVLHLAALIPNLPETYSGPVADSPFAAPEAPHLQADVEEGEGETDLTAPREPVYDERLPRVLCSCSADSTCRLWDVRTWTCVKIITPSAGVPLLHSILLLLLLQGSSVCALMVHKFVAHWLPAVLLGFGCVVYKLTFVNTVSDDCWGSRLQPSRLDSGQAQPMKEAKNGP